MKIRVFTVLLVLALLLTGCSASAARKNSHAASATASTQSGITREQAQTIALEHAGFTAEQVTGLRTEYEVDDGIAHYEVQFRQGRWEYDYEINAYTGEIFSYDRDD